MILLKGDKGSWQGNVIPLNSLKTLLLFDKKHKLSSTSDNNLGHKHYGKF